MTERLDEIRAWLEDRKNIQSTHYYQCWKHHPECMGAALMEEIDLLEEKVEP